MTKHYPMIQVACQDCGELVWITSNSVGRFKHCPKCKIQVKKIWNKRKEVKRRERELETAPPMRQASVCFIGGDYHITTDPDESWGCDSSLTYDDISRLLSFGWLAVGTEFRKEPSKVPTHHIVRDNGILCLRKISDTTPIQVKQPEPYWRLKKCKVSTIA